MSVYVQAKDIPAIMRVTSNMGPGLVCVVGPPGCGKSTAIARYLNNQRNEAVEDEPTGEKGKEVGAKRKRDGGADRQRICVSTFSAKSFPDFITGVFRRIICDLSPHERALPPKGVSPSIATIASVLHQSKVSVLHVVIDDADVLQQEDLSWVRLLPRASKDTRVHVWIIGQSPTLCSKLPGWTRTISVAAPTRHRVNHVVQAMSEDAPTAAATATASLATHTVDHYSRTRPMSGSIATHDVRDLLKRSLALIDEGKIPAQPNALDFAKAWATDTSQATMTSSGQDAALGHIAPSGKLLFVASFFCGAVSAGRAAAILGNAEGYRAKNRNKESDTTGVLSANTHAFQTYRLVRTYDALRKIISSGDTAHDLLEPNLALHHLPVLVSRGAVTQVSGGNGSYHCRVGYNEAVDVAQSLGIDLPQLLPMK